MAKKKALEEVLARLDDIEKWAKQGESNEAIASKFGITRDTLRRYADEESAISSALKKGRSKFVKQIKSALAKKAKGFKYKETVTEVMYDGKGRVVYRKTKTNNKYRH